MCFLVRAVSSALPVKQRERDKGRVSARALSNWRRANLCLSVSKPKFVVQVSLRVFLRFRECIFHRLMKVLLIQLRAKFLPEKNFL